MPINATPTNATPPQAVFSVLFPNPDVYLVAKVEKVLHGTIQSCAEPYQKSGGDVKKVCGEGGSVVWEEGYRWGVIYDVVLDKKLIMENLYYILQNRTDNALSPEYSI